ncbi:NAD(P)-binding domain protein [Cordyceps fumosorosea ARSEF 2679]|uniref:NAD(P)-binding domain protein n=1 Tax=Cordyceps fumosorosea (strain ARSEF 2679) TaxID=1081104 RepID=A0A168B6Q8_CORFA|nr:NAD(P)-binding domain protein [Cordyceps fumosorosea ARSEF 2679]OAA69697.1 NAD(P)-binding domain protein [Cordyceps fumosorosea ARSEF 2679]
MHLILTGATGLVGSAVLEAMIKAADVTQITVLSRRPVPLADAARSPKVRVLLHRDFAAYDDPDLLARLRGASGCVWALGVSQTKVARDEYVKITKDYALAAATAFSGLGGGDPPFRFVYVSGEGATQTPGRFSAVFARVKGETESALADLAAGSGGALRADSVRPAFVDAAGHEAIRPYIPDPGLLYRATAAVLSPVVRAGMQGSHSPTPMLGSFLTQMATGRKDGGLEATGAFRLGSSWIVPNVAIRKSMGL